MKIIPQLEYTSVLKKFKNISERNEAFNMLDKQSQRLEIAWDALNLVTDGMLRASSGSYWHGKINGLAREGSLSPEAFQQELLNPETLSGCFVCQRGLLMVSQIRLSNGLAPSNEVRMGRESSIKGFSYDDFLCMENEYELSKYGHPYKTNTNEKLANICCNVLINGNFDPEDNTNYLRIER